MNKKIYYIGLVIISFFFIGFLICRFVIASNFFEMHRGYIAIGVALTVILNVWIKLKDKIIK